jgi:4-hydroxy-3-methylbut-2-enyl diphosphate reductase IspH
MANADVTLERLDDQIRWYDRKSRHNQRWFKIVKVVQLTAAAAVPVVVAIGVRAAVPAALGASVVVLEGLQQLNQYQQNWTTYRSTAEALKHEKYLFLALAGPYAGASAPSQLLADRIEGLISQEHAKWVSAREEVAHELEQRSSERPADR